jgi:hypothetical protein
MLWLSLTQVGALVIGNNVRDDRVRLTPFRSAASGGPGRFELSADAPFVGCSGVILIQPSSCAPTDHQ